MLPPRIRRFSSTSDLSPNAVIKAALAVVETEGEAEIGIPHSQLVVIDAHIAVRVYGTAGDVIIEVDTEAGLQFIAVKQGSDEFSIERYQPGDWQQTLFAYARQIAASQEPSTATERSVDDE